MQKHEISKKVRILMALAAVGLFAIIISLMLLQTEMQENWEKSPGLRKVLNLGPKEARPQTPSFAIDENNKPLEQLLGKVIYINFWAEWCEPCKKELPYIESLQQKYKGKNFEVILVNMDRDVKAIEKAKAMKERLNPSSMSLFNLGAAFQQLFLVEALPFHVLIDKEGKTATSFYASLLSHQNKFESAIEQLLKE